MIDRKMKKKDLLEAAHLTCYQMLKIARDENITTDVVGNICKVLNCTLDEIMEFYDKQARFIGCQISYNLKNMRWRREETMLSQRTNKRESLQWIHIRQSNGTRICRR